MKAVPLLTILLLISCASHSPSQSDDTFISRNSRVSGCGGFQAARKTVRAVEDTLEAIRWSYDSKTRTLQVLHTGVRLNCCGDHAITATRDEDVIAIAESDREPSTGRCRCMCYYDFSFEIEGIAPEEVRMRLDLTVDSTASRKWAGFLDLRKGSGEIPIPEEN
jgi:hypothetical protein